MADDNRTVTFTIAIKDMISGALADIKNKMEALTSGTAGKSVALPGIEQAKNAAADLTKNVSAAGKATDDAAKSADKLDKGFSNAATGAAKFVTALHAAAGVVETIKALYETTRAISASFSGDTQAQVKAVASAQAAVKSIPLVGAPAQTVGDGIYRLLSASKNLATGDGFRSDLQVADDIAEAAAKIDQHTEAIRKNVELQKAALGESKSFITEVTAQFNAVAKTVPEQQAYELDQLKKKRDEILQGLKNVNFGGQLQPTIDAFTQQTDRAFTKIAQKQHDEYLIQQLSAQAELEEAQLKGVDRTSDAERVAMLDNLQLRSVEAAKAGKEIANNFEKVYHRTLLNFDRDLAERRAKFVNDLNADLKARSLNATGNPDDARKGASIELLAKQQNEAIEKQKALRDSGLSEDQQAFEMVDLKNVQAAERAALVRDQANQRATESLSRLSDEQGELTREIDRTKQAYDVGAITATEAQERTSAAVQKLRDDTARAAADVEGLLAKGILSQAEADALKKRLAEARDAAVQAADVAHDAAVKLQRDTGDALSTFLSDSVKNFNNVRSAAASLFQSISDSILKLVTGNIAKQFTSFLSGGQEGGGLFGAVGSAASGDGAGAASGIGSLLASFGKLLGFSAGGVVPGPSYVTYDSVPAMLTPGEVISPVGLVNAFGGPQAFQHTIAELVGYRSGASIGPAFTNSVQHFSAGGVVQPQRKRNGDPQAVQVVAALVANERNLKTILDGGHPALLRHLGTHRHVIRSILNS